MSGNSVKVVLLGDSSVGKTSLIQRYISGRNDIQNTTLGAVFIQLRHSFKNENNELIDFPIQCWDTAGQERYKALIPMYVRGVNFVIISFDLNNYVSFSNLPSWVSLCKNSSENCKFVLVGCKNDLKPIIRITDEEINKFISDYIPGTKFFSTSSITGNNVDELFEFVKKNLEDVGFSKTRICNKKLVTLKNENPESDFKNLTRVFKKWCF